MSTLPDEGIGTLGAPENYGVGVNQITAQRGKMPEGRLSHSKPQAAASAT